MSLPHGAGAPGGFAPPPGVPSAPSAYGARPPEQASQRAIIALVLAIVGWAGCGCFASVPAIVVSRMELKDIEAGNAPVAGKTLATVAFWVATVNAAFYTLFLLIYFVYVIVVGAVLFTAGTSAP